MGKKQVHDSLSGIMPNRPEDINDIMSAGTRAQGLQQKTEEIAQKVTAKELAAIKRKEQKQLERLEKQEAKYAEQDRLIAEKQTKIDAIEALEADNISLADEVIKERMPAHNKKKLRGIVDLQSTTPLEVQNLLSSLNINMSLHLTKNDTANLLSCLLTCNERQLMSLADDPKVPIAVKIVVKRLLSDVANGAMGTVEKLWDRVFGKAAMTDSSPLPDSAMPGLIPNRPVSREAYVIIRDTVLN